MTNVAPARAGRKQWAGLAVLVLPTSVASLELTLPNLALPAIARDLGPSASQSLWLVDVYGFLLAGSLMAMGALGDRVGRRRLLLFGAAGFGAVSVLAAYAPSVEALIAGRALLGVMGATLMPTALALVATMFADPRQRTSAVGAVIASVAGGTAVGPLIGGWVLEHFWWGATFLTVVPLVLALLVIGPFVLPEGRSQGAGCVDLLSVALSLVAVLSVILGLKEMAENGIRLPATVTLGLGVVAAGVFLRRQRRIDDPLVDLTLFRSRRFRLAIVTLLLGIFALFGTNFLLAQYLQLVLGLSPLAAGLWTVPAALGVLAAATAAPVAARRWPPGNVVVAGLLVAAGGFAVLMRVDPAGGAMLPVVGSVIVSLGLGAMMTLSTDLVVGAVPVARAGQASALSETAPELGGALGVAILGSAAAVVYRGRLSDVSVTEVPAEVAARASETLSGAFVAADLMPPAAGGELIAAAREAFTTGLHTVATIDLVLMSVLALLIAVVIRR
ncbi:MFS transporter [Tsukamurella sp. M9C]|uniref:MFS transporter n=1 Tax=Tsukamurella sp. M9C TaxID=2877520 RepID=UPI001CCB8274|nr:MFS transporter [Tsukamurella sp. M9C]MCA0156331.1 MFS transporter [Tsukamurella sp. M9C]